jgi:glycosyltransferase involved in cell wall biosynthesis
MAISVIIPTYNEESHIKDLIFELLKSKNVISEIFICDAGSTDSTVNIIKDICAQFEIVKYLHNKNKFVSFAFNEAYKLSSGKYIALLGAHAFYPINYLEVGLKCLENGEADVVGGPLNQKGWGQNGIAIALAMSSIFGVGNTEFRTSKKKQFVDSVAFAIYRKEIFEKVGLLNVNLKRNQDDELHYRIKKFGYQILMVPEMESTYYVRESFYRLFNQYYEYGLYKPLVFKLVKKGMRLRHFVPSLFVLYIFSLPFLYLIIGNFAFFPLLLYFVFAFYFAFEKTNSPDLILRVFLAFLILHVSSGVGFLIGIFKKS